MINEMTSTKESYAHQEKTGGGWMGRLVVRLLGMRRDAYWIAQALQPNIEVKIKADWQPKYRLWRFMRKGTCEICGRHFREIEEGTICKRETLCGAHCMMTTQEIVDYNSHNA